MMHNKILLVNPPIFDFSAYDFWLKPYGLLRVGGYLRGQADLCLFDYLDRWHPQVRSQDNLDTDIWGRGPFYSQIAEKPEGLADIPRYYRRYGLPRECFQTFVMEHAPFDVVLIQTIMTYWYLGIQEVIEDIRHLTPQAKIVLGGVYATLCPQHANGLGADLVIERDNLQPLWDMLGVAPRQDELPLWDMYPDLSVGVIKLADGCPFRCTYCSVPQVYPPFAARPLARAYAEVDMLSRQGVQNIAFYDDALLFKTDEILLPFLRWVTHHDIKINFHTPNALNARFITKEIAEHMVNAGFKTFYLGFESHAYVWQRRTGGKVYADEFAKAIENLIAAGAPAQDITAYLIIGHPQSDMQDVEASMQFAHRHGIRVMLSEFSPIPGTPDGERCREWVDLDEPLGHNKTAFPIRLLGLQEVRRLKTLCRHLNQSLQVPQEPNRLALKIGNGAGDLGLSSS